MLGQRLAEWHLVVCELLRRRVPVQPLIAT